jgi:hypothetical protein
MKLSLLSMLAVAGSFATALAAPAAAPAEEAAIDRRQSFDALTLITNLGSQLQPYLNDISTASSPSSVAYRVKNEEPLTRPLDATTAAITPDSTEEEKSAASAAIQSDVNAMAALVNAATATVPKSAKMLVKRQSTTAIAQAIVALLETLSSTVNGIIAALGLSKSSAPPPTPKKRKRKGKRKK